MTPGPAPVSAPPGAVVEVRGVRVDHGATTVLDVPALDVRAGEVLSVIGPNGSGKSTLLRVVGLLQRPTAGEVCFGGRAVDPAHGLAQRRRMATVFQQPLLADASVADNVALGLRFRGLGRAAASARVRDWLGRFGIADLAGRRAVTLSGGEAQRVALARALVLEPELLLLDEPFASLDAPARGALVPDLAAVLRAERVTTLLVTHDRGEAQALADRVAVLIGGRVRQVGATSSVFQAPASEEVARFVGVETLVEGRVLGRDDGVTAVEVAGQVVQVAAAADTGTPVRLCLRPEDVTLSLPGEEPGRSSARNRLAGVVVDVTPSTPQIRVLVDCGFTLVAAVTRRSAEELGLAPGAAVVATFKASAVHLLRAVPSLDTSRGGAL